MPTPTPCLWFDNNAEEAARFYCSIFEHAEMLHPAEPTPKGAHPPFMSDPQVAIAATEAMFKMRKIILADLEAVADAAR